MNRISTTTAHTTRLQAVSAFALVGLMALTGAAWMTITVPAEDVVQLERVVISGVSTPQATDGVKQLPRVVVVGRRDAAADGAQVASADGTAVR
ncbi:MAG: hypothetical protein ACT6S0_22915 [Roseateles sp.]|uniref:hypothetical protein n=1 Tax=Roseateles sp. TaxID=1971397 RepID=UPI0040359BAD